ncbi:hypothetical protein HYH03_016006 [Edaphochlamys debaryana]|uniref:Uncharacterized protein n=1 Tax=Edaphochlamys debaryana TaxID=47281 RepID=A0A835XKS4_9CHLO|nr:hypothetical protein HYH03_016006 [Edaphochlamys debaryana]|eukprot:KAG2485220.1 hypothetical protein HYH03_016006 [Edaphochlamys debaryana]
MATGDAHRQSLSDPKSAAAESVGRALEAALAPRLAEVDDVSLEPAAAAAATASPATTAPAAAAAAPAASPAGGPAAQGGGRAEAEVGSGVGPLLAARLPQDAYGGVDPGQHSVDAGELAKRAPLEGR